MWWATWLAADRLWRTATVSRRRGNRGFRGSTTRPPFLLRGAGTGAAAVGPVEQVDERAELRVGLRDGVEQLARLAAEDHEAVADRPVGVLRGEDRRGEVVGPGEPEEVPLLGLAGRVVRELVEQAVEALERLRQVRGGGREVAYGRAQLPDGRQRGAREGPQLVADDRRRGAQERPQLALGRPERPRGRAQRLQRRAELVGEGPGLAEGAPGDLQRGGQLAQRLAQRGVLAGEAGEDGVGVHDEVGDLVVLVAELLREQGEVVDRALDVRRALGERLVDLARELGGRLDAADRVGEGAAVALEAPAAVVEQQRQIVAGVRVEGGEDLVEVDVRERLGDGDAPAVGEPAGRLGAGGELGDHVLQAGLGAQQDGRVLVDAVVARLDLHADDRSAVLELDALDLADLDARDVDRLPLARRDGLGGLHLRLDHVEVLPDDGDPARQREALVGQDHRAHEDRDEDQADDGREVLDVLADRGHRVELGAAVDEVGADLAAAGPLRFGSLLV